MVKKYKNLAENSLEKLKEFECLNMDLDAKLVLFNKLVDDLKCENESLKMHAKCLIAGPISKNDENICCNHVVVLDFVPIVCSTLKDKSVYIPPHKRNQKVERRLLSQSLHLGLNLRLWMDLSLFNLPPLWCDWSYKTSMSYVE